MSDNIQSMFSVKGIPWHKKGVILNNPPTSEEAIVLAGMNWAVTKERTFYALEDGTMLTEIPGLFAIVRQDTKKVIGKVGRHFEPLQNVKAFAFFDHFIKEGLAQYETAGVLGEGETVWILAKFNGSVVINGDDELRTYLLLANGHDGQTNVLIQPTDIRVVCQNTLNSSLSTGQVVKVRHTPGMTINMQNIQEQVVRLHRNRDVMHQAFHDLATTQVDTTDVAAFITGLWPKPNMYRMDSDKLTIAYQIWEAKQAAFRTLLEHGQGTEKAWMKGTAWWLYNAVVEMVDHYMANRKRIRDKASYVLRGDGAKLKDLAFAQAAALVNKVKGKTVIDMKALNLEAFHGIKLAN